jgi:transposase-like protein
MALVTVCTYRDPIDAEIAKTRLEHADIPAVILDQYLPSIQWLYSFAIGGVKLKVDESDLEDAVAALTEDQSAELSQIPESQMPLSDGDACPACGSFDVRYSKVRRNAAAFSLATGVPLIAWRRRWTCTACNHSWLQSHTRSSPTPEATIRAEALVHEKRSYPVLGVVIAILAGLGILTYVQYQIRNPS